MTKIQKLPKIKLSEEIFVASFPDDDYDYEVGIVKSEGRYKITMFDGRWGDKKEWERRATYLLEIIKNLP